jgi:hypothetical protein
MMGDFLFYCTHYKSNSEKANSGISQSAILKVYVGFRPEFRLEEPVNPL